MMTDVEDLKQRINRFNPGEKEEQYKTAVERLEKKLHEYVQQIEERCNVIDNTIEGLQENMENTVDMETFENKLQQTVQETQRRVQNELADELNQVESVDHRLTHVEKLIENLESSFSSTRDNLASRINTLEESVSTYSEGVRGIKSSLNDVNSNIRQLSRKVEGVQADIDGQEQRLERLERAEQNWGGMFSKVETKARRDNTFGITRDENGRLRTQDGTYIDDMGDLVQEILRSVEALEKEQMRLRQQLGESHPGSSEA